MENISLKSWNQTEAGWEEYYDYIFPDDEGAKPNLKLLSMAKKWKEADDSESEESEEEGDKPDKDGDTEVNVPTISKLGLPQPTKTTDSDSDMLDSTSSEESDDEWVSA